MGRLGVRRRVGELLGNGLVVGALTVGEIARVAELPLVVPLDTMDRLTVSTATGLLFFWVGHGVRFSHSTTNLEKIERRNLEGGARVT